MTDFARLRIGISISGFAGLLLGFISLESARLRFNLESPDVSSRNVTNPNLINLNVVISNHANL